MKGPCRAKRTTHHTTPTDLRKQFPNLLQCLTQIYSMQHAQNSNIALSLHYSETEIAKRLDLI